jgi:RHS repeat-associated protein
MVQGQIDYLVAATSRTSGQPPGVRGSGGRRDRLYFDRARYYSRGLGRFISGDPAGLQGGTDPYAYAAAEPTELTDPSGLCPVCALLVVGWSAQACRWAPTWR